jgi:hypothetical protein
LNVDMASIAKLKGWGGQPPALVEAEAHRVRGTMARSETQRITPLIASGAKQSIARQAEKLIALLLSQ